jgi:hypothetical protein
MRKTSQAATKLRWGSSESDRKPGVSCVRAIEFAGPPMAKLHKSNFTHKDSLPPQAEGKARRSPDGAKRNPGLPGGVDAAPDFAPLHPGYDTRHAQP